VLALKDSDRRAQMRKGSFRTRCKRCISLWVILASFSRLFKWLESVPDSASSTLSHLGRSKMKKYICLRIVGSITLFD
jgi:hypothetical protein